MSTGRSQGLRIKTIITSLCFVVAFNTAAYATGSIADALAGTDVATPPSGVPFNPAAAASVAATNLQAGIAMPFGIGNVGYVSFYEPKDPRGIGAVMSGMLGVTQQKTQIGIDNLTQAPVYYTSNAVSYQVAEKVGNYGAFGVGMRYLQDKNGRTNQTETAWRVDAGWQGSFANLVTVGVVARDVVGSDFSWAGGPGTPVCKPSYHAGAALSLGNIGYVAADLRDFSASGEPQSWGAGLSVNVVPTVTLRGGYRNAGNTETVSLGAGLHIGAWQIDAATTLEPAPTGSVGVQVEF